MVVFLIYYFIGIYLTIADYALLPKSRNRYYVMMGIHLIFTVPSSFFLAKDFIKTSWPGENYFYISILTLFFTVISLSLSGVIVNKIK